MRPLALGAVVYVRWHRGPEGHTPRLSIDSWIYLEFPIWNSGSCILFLHSPSMREISDQIGPSENLRFRRIVLARLTSLAYCRVIELNIATAKSDPIEMLQIRKGDA